MNPLLFSFSMENYYILPFVIRSLCLLYQETEQNNNDVETHKRRTDRRHLCCVFLHETLVYPQKHDRKELVPLDFSVKKCHLNQIYMVHTESIFCYVT